jgi:hypothetical protein
MQLAIHRRNGGQFQWSLVEDGAKPAASATAFRSARDAQRAAADVRLHAGSAAGTEEH